MQKSKKNSPKKKKIKKMKSGEKMKNEKIGKKKKKNSQLANDEVIDRYGQKIQDKEVESGVKLSTRQPIN